MLINPKIYDKCWKSNVQHFQELVSDIATPHLHVHSLDDTRDDVKHMHFGVALSHLLQQLEEQPENRLEVLNKERMLVLGKEDNDYILHRSESNAIIEISNFW